MSAEEFWHGPPRLAAAYREAERIRRDNRYLAEWRMGVYVYEALLSSSAAFRELSKGVEHAYPKEPLFSTSPAKKEDREGRQRAEMEKKKEAFMAMAAAVNARFASEPEGQGEQ